MRLARLTLVALLAAAATARAQDPRPGADLVESYRAHVGAAEAALRLHEVASARDWLETAPRTARGWEWRYLDARCDQSLAAVEAHDGRPVFGLRLSPDGGRVVTAGFDGTARVWDTATLGPAARPLAVLAGHADGLWGAAFVGDGARIATASGDRTSRLFDARSGEPLATLWENDTPVSCVDVSPDGKVIAASAYRWVRDADGERVSVEGLVQLFDAATGEAARLLVGGVKPISLIRFSPDGTRLAASCWDAQVHVWDVASGEEVLALDMQAGETYSAADAVAWSPEGTLLAAGSKAAQVRLFDAATGERLRTLEGHVGFIGGLAFRPDGDVLASGAEDGTVRLWEVSTGRPLAVLHGHRALVHGMAFAPDGRRLYTASDDGTLRVWPGDPAQAAGLVMSHCYAYTLAYSPDGTRLASSSYDGQVRVWGADQGTQSAEFDFGPPSLNVVAFAPDGSRLAAARLDGTGFVCDAATGEILASLGEGGTGVSGIAFSPDGGRVALTHYDDRVRLLQAASGEVIWHAEGSAGPRNGLGSLAFSPDGRRIAAPFGEGVRLLEAATGATERVLDGAGGRVHSAAFTPDGAVVLAAAEGGWVTAWDAATGARAWSQRGHAAGPDRVHVAPDGERAVSVAHDLVIWDVAHGTPLLRLRLDANDLYDAAFSPDGTRLAVLGTDHTIHILDARPARAR